MILFLLGIFCGALLLIVAVVACVIIFDGGGGYNYSDKDVNNENQTRKNP